MPNKTVSLVLPMYNEIEYLPKVVDAACSVLEKASDDYEIIIIDDCSTDGSGELADVLRKNNSRIKVIHHRKNRKLGGALKTGFSSATKDIIVYTDMDMPFDLAVLNNLLPMLSEFDFIIGCRRGKRESFLRRVYSWGYNNLINRLFNLGVKDVNFALKIFRREVLDRIELKSEGSFINAEFLAKARKLGYSLKEVEVEYNLRTFGISRLSTPAVILKILYELILLFPGIKSFSRKKADYRRVKRSYEKIPPAGRLYNFFRLKTCPFDLIAEFVPNEGAVLDLGCGSGLFLNLLSHRFNKNLFFGRDWDKRKIDVAKAGVKQREKFDFGTGDIFKDDIDLPLKARCVVIIDVLYYFDLNQKRQLLKKCHSLLEKDGVLVVKDIGRETSFKFLWVFLQELLAVKLFRFTLAKSLYFETKKNYLSLFREAGFTADYFDLNKGYFYPHILYVCRK